MAQTKHELVSTYGLNAPAFTALGPAALTILESRRAFDASTPRYNSSTDNPRCIRYCPAGRSKADRPASTPLSVAAQVIQEAATHERRRVISAQGADCAPKSSRHCLGYLHPASPTSSLPAPDPTPTASDTQSLASVRYSPSQQVSSLEPCPDGVKQRNHSLADPSLPPALCDLLQELRNCSGSRVVILKSDLRAEIREEAKRHGRFRVLMDHMFVPVVDCHQLEPTPRPTRQPVLFRRPQDAKYRGRASQDRT